MSTHRTPANAPDLHLLDPATTTRGDRAHTPAAQQLLARILETPRTAPAPDLGTTPARAVRRTGAPRRAWLLAGAAALVAGAVVVPTLGGGPGAAFASWTPVPGTVPAAEATTKEAECLASGENPSGALTGAVTERRGDFTFTLVATDQGFNSCMVFDAAPTGPNGPQEQGASSWARADSLPLPAAGDTAVQWGQTFTSAVGSYTSAVGRVGSDVTAVQITPRGEETVRASVGDGYFTAWWPGKRDDHLSVTTTLTDGSTTTRALSPGEQ